MYDRVPRKLPGAVSGSFDAAVGASATDSSACGPSLARPKSSSFARGAPLEPDSMTFAGFRSRWRMPRPWAAASASAICAPTSSTWVSGSGPASQAIGEGLPFHVLHDEEVQGAAGRVRL